MKKIIVCLLLFLSVEKSFSQMSIKMSQLKYQSWNSYLKKWSGWPDKWTYFSKGSEPILKLTKLDDGGSRFKIEQWINDKYSVFTVRFDKYETKNEWYSYKDESNDYDEITVKGVTLSSLCQYGWPQNRIQIYFWIYSADFAVVME